MSMPTMTASLLEWALWYASQGHPVFPCHTPTKKGCSCGDNACPNVGKHPRIKEWQKEATTTTAQIEKWWKQWPIANIGLATGQTLWVLDIDPRHGGDNELYDQEKTHGVLPETPRSKTGGGGIHFFFALSQAGVIRNAASIAPGIDVRGLGGFVIIPPSLHVSGQYYAWDAIELEETPLAEAPRWLLDQCQPGSYAPPISPGAPILSGERNNTLSRQAYGMRRLGMTLPAIYAGIKVVNENQCQPPLDEEELKLIVEGKKNVGPDPILKISSRHKENTSVILPPHETLTHLLADNIPPPRQLFHKLMHEGMLLFGGKSKRGKSWLIYDLSIALALGESAFGEFVCYEPTPVLYLALEDGRARLQARAKEIKPGLVEADRYHLRYEFPRLDEGGVKLLADEIQRYQYGLVIIDVLAKLEPPKLGKGDKNYNDIYDMFAPLQELRKHHPFCLTMLTHLRKQEAEDVFDALLGSVAYQGAQDVLWVLERKPKDDYAFLHIRDKDAEDQAIVLRFVDGHFEYIGEGEEFEVSRDQRKVIEVLNEEACEMSLQQIIKALGAPDSKYGYYRKLLSTMAKDDLVHRMRHGSYSATAHGIGKFKNEEEGEGVFV